MYISMIAAMTRNHVIGVNNTLPWRLPVDLKRFKTITMGKPIIMGRKTYESIGKPLPGRTNIILTQQKLDIPACSVVHSVAEALQLTQSYAEAIVIGGAQIYQTFLPLATRLYLTIIETELEGDAFFPSWDKSAWKIVEESFYCNDNENPYDLHFVTLERENPLVGSRL